MKTALTFPTSSSPIRIMNERQILPAKAKGKVVLKTDLRNHRFAIIENEIVQNPLNWDESWFGNYE